MYCKSEQGVDKAFSFWDGIRWWPTGPAPQRSTRCFPRVCTVLNSTSACAKFFNQEINRRRANSALFECCYRVILTVKPEGKCYQKQVGGQLKLFDGHIWPISWTLELPGPNRAGSWLIGSFVLRCVQLKESGQHAGCSAQRITRLLHLTASWMKPAQSFCQFFNFARGASTAGQDSLSTSCFAHKIHVCSSDNLLPKDTKDFYSSPTLQFLFKNKSGNKQIIMKKNFPGPVQMSLFQFMIS